VDRYKTKSRKRWKRHRRVRRKVAGGPERPRLAVFRSLRHIYAQVIDDVAGTTLVAASTLEKAAEEVKGKPRPERAQWVGQKVAQRALEKGIQQVCFDRGGFRYHGRVKALAEGARKGGLGF
jgi:large subunit ribosomal protein L18